MTDDPAEIIERMNSLIADTADECERTKPLDDGVDPIAKEHREIIQRRAKTDDTGG